MLKTYCFSLSNGNELELSDVKYLDDTHNTYSVYDKDDILVASIPISHVNYVGIVRPETGADDEQLIKAEGSE